MRDTTDSADDRTLHDLRLTARMTDPGHDLRLTARMTEPEHDQSRHNKLKSPENIATLRASLFSKRRRLPTLPHCIAVPSA